MRFSARCTHCETEVLSDVAQLSDAELARMRDHLRVCAPSVATDRLRELGALLHHFQVTTTTT
jgi:hypothetical protein